MASGGLVLTPTRAVVGESGPEIVLPLEEVGDFVQRMTNDHGSRDGGEQIAVFNINVGDEALDKIIMKKLRDRWVRI